MLEKNLSDRVDKMEVGTNKVFRIVFERLDNLEENLPAGKGAGLGLSIAHA